MYVAESEPYQRPVLADVVSELYVLSSNSVHEGNVLLSLLGFSSLLTCGQIPALLSMPSSPPTEKHDDSSHQGPS